MELAPMDSLLQQAADLAAAKAEETMEAVMCEAVRLLREELRAEVKEVADSTDRLAQAQEELKKQVKNQKAELAACIDAQKQVYKEEAEVELNRGILEDQGPFASYVKGQEGFLKRVVDKQKSNTCEASAGYGPDNSGIASRDPLDVLRSLEVIRDQLKIQSCSVRGEMNKLAKEVQDLKDYVDSKISGLHARPAEICGAGFSPAQSARASKQQVDRQISFLHVQLSETKEYVDSEISDLSENQTECNSEHSPDSLVKMHEIPKSMSKESMQIDVVASSKLEAIKEVTCSNLEVIREALLSELSEHREDTEDRVGEKLTELEEKYSKVHAHSVYMKGKQETSSADAGATGPAPKDIFDRHGFDLHAHLSRNILGEPINDQFSEMKGQAENSLSKSCMPPFGAATQKISLSLAPRSRRSGTQQGTSPYQR